MVIKPCQNAGIATPIRASTISRLSIQVFCLMAEIIPIGMERSTANAALVNDKSMVVGSRSITSSKTGRFVL